MEKFFTTFDVAKICGVYPTTVVDWIDSGKLKAFATPGGHRRIKEDELLRFLKEYNIPFNEDLRKQRPLRLLIVDDDAAVVKILTKIIMKNFSGIELNVAIDGFEAGIKTADLKPDLMLLDIMLPGINGFNVCRQIKSNEKTKNVKIIAMTGYDTEENKNKMLECGADDYIAKPFDAGALVEKINVFIRNIIEG